MTSTIKTMEDLDTLNESELEELYSWVDKIPLSRPKRNINRDFSDGGKPKSIDYNVVLFLMLSLLHILICIKNQC